MRIVLYTFDEIMSDYKNTVEEHVEWLSLSKAAALLGVHTVTLRRWSDNGRFPSYRTAGGHRRFSLADIQQYIARQNNVLPIQASSTWASTAIVQARQKVTTQNESGWFQAIESENLRDEYRQMGHQLMGLLLQYLAADEPKASFLEEAARIGRRQAQLGRRAGLSLSAILEATLFFRDILVESSLQIPSTIAIQPEANLRILRRVNQLLNTVQIAVVNEYQQAA